MKVRTLFGQLLWLSMRWSRLVGQFDHWHMGSCVLMRSLIHFICSWELSCFTQPLQVFMITLGTSIKIRWQSISTNTITKSPKSKQMVMNLWSVVVFWVENSPTAEFILFLVAMLKKLQRTGSDTLETGTRGTQDRLWCPYTEQVNQSHHSWTLTLISGLRFKILLVRFSTFLKWGMRMMMNSPGTHFWTLTGTSDDSWYLHLRWWLCDSSWTGRGHLHWHHSGAMLHSLLQFSLEEMTDTNQLTAREIAAILTLFNHFSSYEIQEITCLDLCEISTLFDKLSVTVE